MTTDPLSKTRQFEYDSDRNVVSFTNERGYEWTATYGDIGNLATLSSPISGQTWTYTWEQVGGEGSNFWRVTQAEDPADKWVQYEYADPEDPNEPDDATKIVRIIEMPATGGGSTAVTRLKYYDDSVANYLGQLFQVIDANGVTHQFEYNQWGYLTTTREGLLPSPLRIPETVHPNIKEVTTDGAGQPNGGGSEDDLNKCWSITISVLGVPVTIGCLCEGPAESVPRLGKVAAPYYGFATPQCLSYASYDIEGRPLELDRCMPEALGTTVENNRENEFIYDDYRRLSSMTVSSSDSDPNHTGVNFSREFSYDLYDEDNRVLERTGPDSQTTYYTYDELGRVETVDRGTMSADIEYFDDSTVKKVTYGNGAAVYRTYDTAGRLISIEHKDASSTSVLLLTNTWTINNWLDTRTETTASGTVTVDYDYDNRGRLIREKRTAGTTTIYDIEYEYDQLGNRTTRYDNVAERRTDFTYDTDLDPNTMAYPTRNNRLVEYRLYDTSGQSDVLLRTVSYVYYKTGWASNITIKDEYVDGATSPGDPNDYDWYHDLALYYYTNGMLHSTLAGTWLPDPNGNPDEDTYTTESLGGREFRYDRLRARYATIRYNTPSTDRGTWTVAGDMHWTDYDGDIPYGDFDIEPGTLTRNEVTRYLGLAGQQAVTGGAETYYHGDQIGSTMATSDDNGDIAGHSGGTFAPIAYTAFGEFLDASGLAGGDPPSGHPRYAYAGAFGYETGGFGGDDRLLWRDGANPNLPPITLQHVGARWYQPEVGRFVQRDPIGVHTSLNVYAYAASEPTRLVDPLGLYFRPPYEGPTFGEGGPFYPYDPPEFGGRTKATPAEKAAMVVVWTTASPQVSFCVAMSSAVADIPDFPLIPNNIPKSPEDYPVYPGPEHHAPPETVCGSDDRPTRYP